MKFKIFIAAFFLISANALLFAQSVIHPWYVVDRGGGTSTSAGVTLQGSIGQTAVQIGTSGGFILEGGYIPGIRELPESTSSSATVLDVATEDSWNLVSVPLIVSDYRKTSLYPTGISQAFAYTGAYQVRDTLKNGVGYWIKFPAQKSVEFTGTTMAQETVDVENGWNMIGCTSNPALISAINPIPPTAVTSSYFGFSGLSGYYSEDTLKPGHGYWVKVDNTGKIVLNASSIMRPSSSPSNAATVVMKPHAGGAKESNALDDFNTLTIRDFNGRERTLYFAASASNIDLSTYELPPIPPAFDVRYTSNSTVETVDKGTTKETGIRISSAEYPVMISWKSQDDATLLVGGKALSIRGSGETQIPNDASRISLKLASSTPEIPKQFALMQNYPNPFNPSTVIRYDLPMKSTVTLKIYNLLGEEVATLVGESQDAGYKSVTWDAGMHPSGMYFYRLIAGAFTETKKLLIVK